MDPRTDSATRGSRKYTIRSNFGQARQPRSRKNRPCDACRRRKTACVIADKPPCLFCTTKGLVCRSSAADAAAAPDPTASPVSTGSATPDTASGSEHHQVATSVHHGLIRQPTPASGAGSSLALYSPSAPLHALEDLDGRTSHSMGLAGEQDTYFLDSFRSVLLSEQDEVDANIIQVYDGSLQAHQHPVHFLLLLNGFPEHTNRAMREASDAIEGIVWPNGPALVRLYFSHVHPAYPVVSKVRFLRKYAAAKLDIPASLRGAIYALACPFWYRDASLPNPCPFQQHELLAHCHTTLRRELEAPNLLKLQACLLLLHITPPDIDSVETPSTWILASQATACAQMIGLHQDPGPWTIATWEKRLRRKLWWASYAVDCWSAVCHGNPPHIGPDTFDTAAPTLDDLRFDEDVPEDLQYLVYPENTAFSISNGARFLEMVNIARSLRTILDCSFQVKKNMSSMESRGQLTALRERLKDWPSLIPQCLAVDKDTRHNGPLHLSFHATQVLLFRGLMYPATREAKATPGSNLRQWLTAALAQFKVFTAFMGEITEEELTGFWVRHARSQLILCGNFLIYLFLLASEPHDIEAAYQLLEKFHQSLQRLGATKDDAARALLRPAMLRIDSFFMQATELIKQGRNGVAASPAVSSS
ncbi:fungal-specific transcription factor domain-containing protein [Dactylonectria estremocensis]|uniref:Fungal-specific transcription factor domain-containing protein n=1 Tax=Dactylonectria estremocensis TaxID=1079267 RepID=A0A9P9DIU3_9HYPO|nr:fungal-specific transcription factor domain-containing protein [Dactylonectria estremocensis]